MMHEFVCSGVKFNVVCSIIIMFVNKDIKLTFNHIALNALQ